MAAMQADPRFNLLVVVSAMHLSPTFGMTRDEILRDGFEIDAEVEMLLASDSGAGVVKSCGLGLIGFAETYRRLAPEIILLLGDRFETMAAAQAALMMRLPIVHLAGGDVTEAAFDDAIRHAITKMSHVHLVFTEQARRRVLQLGESPDCVHTVGNPGLDQLRTMELPDRNTLADDLGINFRERTILVTFHPVTLDAEPSTVQFQALLDALDGLSEQYGVVVTKPNADPEGQALIAMVDRFAAARDHVSVFTSLGTRRYLGLMALADVVVGNSSSGLLEAPSLGTPTVNIGGRQDGRARAASVVDCPARSDRIAVAIEEAVALDCREVENPYGDGQSTGRIVEIVADLDADRKSVV